MIVSVVFGGAVESNAKRAGGEHRIMCAGERSTDRKNTVKRCLT